MTSPAILEEKPEVSNLEIRVIPPLPSKAAFQFFSVPTPKGETRPMPVIATRLEGTTFLEERGISILNLYLFTY